MDISVLCPKKGIDKIPPIRNRLFHQMDRDRVTHIHLRQERIELCMAKYRVLVRRVAHNNN